MLRAPPPQPEPDGVAAPVAAPAQAGGLIAVLRSPRRWRLWVVLVLLLVVAQSLLVALTLRYEEARAQERTDEAATAAQAEIRRRLQLVMQGLQGLPTEGEPAAGWRQEAAALMRSQREVGRLELRDLRQQVVQVLDSPVRAPLFAQWPRQEMGVDTELACNNARRTLQPSASRSQFVPLTGGQGVEVIDLCVPVQSAGQLAGYAVATVVLSQLLDEVRQIEPAQAHELSFTEADGTRLARTGVLRGAGVFVAQRLVDLSGASLQVRADATARRPGLIPNVATALVLGLSVALFVVVLLLARDGRRRQRAEQALAEALAFRKAMEDSLITGLRARDRAGRIVYVNPAFCAMVGFSANELQSAEVPPYWPPDRVPVYEARQRERLAQSGAAPPMREGYETEFMRKSGERFPVMVYEAPLVDGAGHHTGWMSAVLDVSAQRRMEDLSRQQQESLQASARLASVGEMASLLSHELNQPLAAIASYATGSLNLMAQPEPDTLDLVRQATGRIAEQAERAGRVIKSVHDFVRRRHQAHEVIAADALIESVLPLVRLQARKSGTRVEVQVSQPVPRVRVDRTMVEQVLLNLARNGIQAMEHDTPLDQRVLTLQVGPAAQARWALFSVQDAGPGVPPELGERMFQPFFTTRVEGMGLGLSLCRTVVEQHGGSLEHVNLPPVAGPGAPVPPAAALAEGADAATPAASAQPPVGAGGAVFRFTLPVAVGRQESLQSSPP